MSIFIYRLSYLQAIGEFILTEPNICIKPRGKIYSLNEGYEQYWDDATREYVKSRKYPKVNKGSVKVAGLST